MSQPTADVFSSPLQADSLTRADALEREITDLCAQINAASYRLLQLIAELDDRGPVGRLGAQVLRALAQLALRHRHERGERKGPRRARAEKPAGNFLGLRKRPAQLLQGACAIAYRLTAANEAELLELAHHATAAQVEKLVRALSQRRGSHRSPRRARTGNGQS